MEAGPAHSTRCHAQQVSQRYIKTVGKIAKGSKPVNSALSVPAVASFDNRWCSESYSKPFRSHVAFGQGVYHSNRKKQDSPLPHHPARSGAFTVNQWRLNPSGCSHSPVRHPLLLPLRFLTPSPAARPHGSGWKYPEGWVLSAPQLRCSTPVQAAGICSGPQQ